jgi:hypothetical protein
MTTAYDTGPVTAEAIPAPAVNDSSVPLPPSPAWEEATAQLGSYFRAFGLDDAGCLQRLARQVQQRLAAKAVAPENLPPAAMEAAQHLLDEWLAQVVELSDSQQRHPLAAARAALRFNRELADWPEAFLQKTIPAQLRSTLQTAMAPPVPPPRERTMTPQKIDFWHPLTGPVHGFLKLIKRLYRR